MTGRRVKLSAFTIFLIRSFLSLVIVGAVTGLNVPQLFLQSPFRFFEILYDEIRKAGNILLIGLLIAFLYGTNWDKRLLQWIQKQITS